MGHPREATSKQFPGTFGLVANVLFCRDLRNHVIRSRDEGLKGSEKVHVILSHLIELVVEYECLITPLSTLTNPTDLGQQVT